MLSVAAPCLADDELIQYVILPTFLLDIVVAHYVLISYNCQLHCHNQSGFSIVLIHNAVLLDVVAPQ
jgi:hypothetical protein